MITYKQYFGPYIIQIKDFKPNTLKNLKLSLLDLINKGNGSFKCIAYINEKDKTDKIETTIEELLKYLNDK